MSRPARLILSLGSLGIVLLLAGCLVSPPRQVESQQPRANTQPRPESHPEASANADGAGIVPAAPNELTYGGVSVAALVQRNSPSASLAMLRPKALNALWDGPQARWTPTPRPSLTPLPSPTPAPTFVSDPSASNLLDPLGKAPEGKWIDVSLDRQHLAAFEGRRLVFQTKVSTGTAAHPTVTGQFRIWLRFTSQDMNGRRLGYDYYLPDVPYVQYFYQDYALHGTYWHNNFGQPMSHGCVNLPTPAAEWLFEWADYGTLVNIHP